MSLLQQAEILLNKLLPLVQEEETRQQVIDLCKAIQHEEQFVLYERSGNGYIRVYGPTVAVSKHVADQFSDPVVAIPITQVHRRQNGSFELYRQGR